MRPGVFASAIHKLNLLEPELVISVGDLIEGYTQDRARVMQQWEQFDALVGPLKAPFFYVPGNHDLSNATMHRVWQERYGPRHYSFVYRHVLFVCLNTMDGGHHQVGEQQLAWLRRTLSQHADVSWTLFFMHTPLWDGHEGLPGGERETAQWERIERVLGDRRYTAFAGHHHRYLKHERGGRKLFTLATAGGVSSLRGPRFGEFDQVVWVTMTPEGPVIANLLLEGIWDEDVRTVELRAFERQLLAGLVPSTLYYEAAFRRSTSELSFRNDRDMPLELDLFAEPPTGLRVLPPQLKLTAAPGSVVNAAFEIRATSPLRSDAVVVPLLWRARTTVAGGESVQLNGKSAIALVKLFRAERAGRPAAVDGALDDWRRFPIVVERPRQVLRNASALRGPQDNRFRAAVEYDTDFVYIAVEVTDDSVTAVRDARPWEQDGVEIRVDARPDPVRSHSGGAGDGKQLLLLALSPSYSADDDWLVSESWVSIPGGTQVACVRTKTGFVTEAAIPRSWLDQAAGTRATVIRVNIAVNDRDADGQSQSWWWPDWRTDEDLPGSGTIRLGR
jgi:hypothetical protein